MRDIDLIASDFELLGDWDQRYQYLIELGEVMDPMPESEKVDDNRVIPCMSMVWVRAFRDSANPNRIGYHGDCDTAIIKGVVALLVNLFSGKSPREVIDTDVDELFDRISLGDHLSPNRHVGVYAIVDLMKAQAAQLSSLTEVA